MTYTSLNLNNVSQNNVTQGEGGLRLKLKLSNRNKHCDSVLTSLSMLL